MAINQEADASCGNVFNINFHAPINTEQFLAGSGSNFKNQKAMSTPEMIEAQHSQLQQDCNEIKSNSREKAEQNCSIDQVKFVAHSNFAINYVPLQMVQVNQIADIEETRNAKREIAEISIEQVVNELQPETFFITSRKFAESSDIYKNLTANSNATKEMKESCLNKLSNVVFVVGHAGIGKTCLAKKYLQLVLNKKVDVGFLFYIKFRDVDYKNKISLMTFLTGDDRYEQYDEQRLENILEEISNNDNVTIVLDGMDESKIQIDEARKANTNPYKKTKAQNFILGLLNGSILCKSKKLFTSRPKQLFDLPKQYQPLFIIKLLGIDQTSQKLICKNICGDDFDAVFKQIQSNSDLSNYCSVPLICIIIVYCLYKYFKEKQYIPCSLSEIFVILICMYIEDPTHLRGKLPLKGLCELAFSGISNQKLFFDHDYLKLFSLDKEDKNNFTVTVQCYNRTDEIGFLTNATLQYTYFSHLIVQEWFAALYLMLYAETKEFKEVLFTKKCKINLRSTNFDVFVKFLFGLSNESMFKKYSHNLPHKIDLKSYSQKVNLLKNYIKSIKDVFHVNDSVYCWLHELKDEEVTQQAADNLKNDFFFLPYNLLPNNITAIFSVLRCRRKKINLKVVWAREPNLLEELGTCLKQNINIKLKDLWLLQLNDWNISASIFLLLKAEVVWVYDFISFEVALKFSDAVLQREHRLKMLRLFYVPDDYNISAICSCLKNIEEFAVNCRFRSFGVALKLRDAVMYLEHPMKKLECYNCSEDVGQCLLLCKENVEELIINERKIHGRSCLIM